jgi:hypothetical protein
MITSGMLAADFYELLLLQLGVSTALLAPYSDPPKFTDRASFSIAESSRLAGLRVARARDANSYLDEVVKDSLKQNAMSFELLDALAFHQELIPEALDVARHVHTRGWIADANRVCDSGKNLALLSLVETSDGKAHIPMMDFSCPPTLANYRLCLAICEKVFACKSVILNSGKSLHGVGMELCTDAARTAGLALALQYAPIVDRFYISHQLRQRFSALRVSGGTRHVVPQVVLYSDRAPVDTTTDSSL